MGESSGTLRNNDTNVKAGTALCVVLGFLAIGSMSVQQLGGGWRRGRAPQQYTVTAKFDNIGGLKVGAQVKMSGVRLGRVEAIGLDPSDHKAVVGMNIDQRYAEIPTDSAAAIQASSLLGGSYIGITPGAADTFLSAGSRIPFTQSAFQIEDLMGKLLGGVSGKSAATDSNGGSK